MGEYRVSGPEIKKQVKLMRKQPLAFAYNPGNGSDDYLCLHRTKGPSVLGREAKDEGPGNKHAFGMASVEGKILSLTCEREVPGLAKKLKKYLKSQNVNLNIRVLDADGNLLEDDIEDLPDEPDDDDDDDAAAPAGDAGTREEERAAEPAAAAAPMGLVAKRAFLIERWKKIPGELTAELGVLNREIAAKVPDEDPDDLCEGVREWLAEMVADMQSQLDDAIDEAINAGDHSYAAVSRTINDSLRPRIAGDKVLMILTKGKLMPGKGFEATFEKALSEIESALTR